VNGALQAGSYSGPWFTRRGGWHLLRDSKCVSADGKCVAQGGATCENGQKRSKHHRDTRLICRTGVSPQLGQRLFTPRNRHPACCFTCKLAEVGNPRETNGTYLGEPGQHGCPASLLPLSLLLPSHLHLGGLVLRCPRNLTRLYPFPCAPLTLCIRVSVFPVSGMSWLIHVRVKVSRE
jgi:hypothetical protein